MAKVKTSFICQQCGASSHAYLGRCPGCGAWNSMIETIEERPQPARVGGAASAELPQPLTALGATAIERFLVPISELDRVLGGGLVPGSLVLIGGDPGIGKSTLVLQAAAALAGVRRTGALCLRRGIGAADADCAPIGWASMLETCSSSRRPISTRFWRAPMRDTRRC